MKFYQEKQIKDGEILQGHTYMYEHAVQKTAKRKIRAKKRLGYISRTSFSKTPIGQHPQLTVNACRHRDGHYCAE
jgi:hypothetical protein